MLGFCSSARFVEHDTGPHHPERPDRIRAIHKAVRDAGLVRSANPFPDFDLDFGLRPLPDAPSWFGCFDVVQVNEDEMRQLSPDPLGFGVSDLNRYRYAGNEPLIGADPSGTFAIPIGCAIACAAPLLILGAEAAGCLNPCASRASTIVCSK